MTSSLRGNTSSDQALQDTVTRLVTSALGKKPGSVGPDTPLFSSQFSFDSFSLLELVLRLEDTFGLSIPDEDLDPNTFHSVKTIASYLQVRLEQRD
jgi:acyl carrier protein